MKTQLLFCKINLITNNKHCIPLHPKMTTPAANLALLIIALFILIGLIGYLLRTQIKSFVQVIIDARDAKAAENTTSTTAAATTTESV